MSQTKADPPDAEPRRDPDCTGPFSDAFDCPVHDPRKAAPVPASPAGGSLQALVVTWRTSAQWESEGMTNIQYAAALEQCADDLDAILAVASPSAPDCADQLRTLARDIGTVADRLVRKTDEL